MTASTAQAALIAFWLRLLNSIGLLYYRLSMLEFQERRRLRKILYSPYAAGVLIVLALLLVRSVWNLYTDKYVTSIESFDKTESELRTLQQRRAQLEEDIALISTERGREEVIRETYQVAKPGERSIQIIDDQNATSNTASVVIELSWWQRFVRMIE